jgi:hypothetical protein
MENEKKPPTLEERLSAVEMKIEVIIRAVSEFGGEADATSRALSGLLRELSPESRQRKAVESSLEEGIATCLHESTNPAYVDRYELVMKRLLGQK